MKCALQYLNVNSYDTNIDAPDANSNNLYLFIVAKAKKFGKLKYYNPKDPIFLSMLL